MKRTKTLIKTAIVALVFMLSIAVSFAITGAWYLATRNAKGTITLNDGIIIDYSGFDQGAGVWENNAEFSLFGNGSAMLPGASVNLNDAAIKANYSSADFFARVKLEYKFFTDLAGEYEVTNQISDYSAFINTPTFAQGWVDGRNGDGWFYYATGSTFNTLPSADYVNIFTPNQSITLNGDAAGFDHQGGGYQYDEFTLIKRIEVVLTLSTYQADLAAAANAGWTIVPAYTDAAGVVYTQNANETWTLTNGTALSNNSSSSTATYGAKMYDSSSYSYTVLSQINNQDVVAIGDNAFLNAIQLTEITIPATVSSVGTDAFTGTGLNTVTIEKDDAVVSGIETAGIPTASTINVPGSVFDGYETTFGSAYTGLRAAAAPSGLTLNAVASDNSSYGAYMATDSDGNKWYFDYGTLSSDGSTWTKNNSNGTQVQIRYYVIASKFSNGQTLTIPSLITSSSYSGSRTVVEIYGWDNSKDTSNKESMVTVSMSDSIKSLGDYAFYCCRNLVSISLSNSLKHIGSNAFYDCGLTSITIPSSVTLIDGNPFSPCKNLSSFSASGTYSTLSNNRLLMKGSVLVAFAQSGISSLNIPNSVTEIEYGAFGNCTNLTSVTIPNSVTLISTGAFEFCINLSSVTLGNSVQTIMSNAFFYCYNLNVLTINSATIAALNYSDSYLLDHATTVYVKNGLLVGSYITGWGHTTTSDKDGYVKYVKNS